MQTYTLIGLLCRFESESAAIKAVGRHCFWKVTAPPCPTVKMCENVSHCLGKSAENQQDVFHGPRHPPRLGK